MSDNIFLDRICAFEMGDNQGFPMKVACPDKAAREQHRMVVMGKRKQNFKSAVKFMFRVCAFKSTCIANDDMFTIVPLWKKADPLFLKNMTAEMEHCFLWLSRFSSGDVMGAS